MNQLVFESNNQVVTNSRNVARDFNKRHSHVLDAIDEIKGVTENSADLFYETTYIHEQNKQEYRQYLMNRDGFTLLVMGFTGKAAMKFKIAYMNAFNQMEKQLEELSKPSYMLNDPIERAKKWIEEQEEVKLLEQENEEMKPKATYHDAVLQSESLLTVTSIAKDLGMGAPTLNKKLHELGVQYKRGGRWYLYHQHQDKGYTQSKTHLVAAGKTKETMYWTQKGKRFIFDLLEEKEGIVPPAKDDAS